MLYYAKFKSYIVYVVILFGIWFALPNFLPDNILNQVPKSLVGSKLNLGLDLQGGAHLLLEVDTKPVIESQLNDMRMSIRRKLLRDKIFHKNFRINKVKNSISFDLIKAEEYEHALTLIRSINLFYDISQNGNNVTVALSEKNLTELLKDTVNQSIEIIRRRVDSTGTKEPVIQKQGKNRIILELAGIKDASHIKKLLGRTAKMNFYLVADNSSDENNVVTYPETKTGQMLPVDTSIGVSGANLKKAAAAFNNNAPVVSFAFNGIGAQQFYEITKNNKGRRLAIVLDGKIISAPNINGAINGQGIIEGGFTVQETNDLSVLLQAGALPAPLTIVEERTVGPGLGQDSINAGKIASLTGVAVVIVFMVMIYRRFGLYANVALVVNLILIIAIMSILQATFTLPGIAGIVLTIGMAVDANVLIYERIREELQRSLSVKNSIDLGYKSAFLTIVDANTTTLIATIILYIFGSGPVKGFAVTLTIGTLMSMFTAMMLTQLFVYKWYNKNKPKTLDL